jgi:hypothetical protein
MGIDGIGKPGSGVPTPGSVSPASSTSGKDFGKVLEGTSTQAAEAATASPDLTKLANGELSLDQYLDARVDAAVAHVQGQLDASQLAYVKSSLREQLSTDPVLVELVKRATGADPSQQA